MFVYAVERVSRGYEEFLTDRQMFWKTLSFINRLTGSMRAAIFRTFERYVTLAKRKKLSSDINEIAMSLQAVSKDVLADINDEN